MEAKYFLHLPKACTLCTTWAIDMMHQDIRMHQNAQQAAASKKDERLNKTVFSQQVKLSSVIKDLAKPFV